MRSAVLMIVFCRPETTKQVFEAVRLACPPRLYIASDAPRPEIEGEVNRCMQVQEIFNSIDWPCKVYRLNQNENIGCSRGPYEAISWFFSQESEGIILEDDVVPEQSFFRFCDDMLEKFRNNDNIQMISGWSFFYKGFPKNYPFSYYFSTAPGCWGWATWKNRWEEVDLKIRDVDRTDIEKYMTNIGYPQKVIDYYMNIFDNIKRKFDIYKSWDFQFHFYMMRKQRLSVSPIKQLTRNVGLGVGATHGMDKVLLKLKSYDDIYPLSEPERVCANIEFDKVRFKVEHIRIPTKIDKLYLRFRINGGKILRRLGLKRIKDEIFG